LVDIVKAPHQLDKGLRIDKCQSIGQCAALELIGPVQKHPAVDVAVAAQGFNSAHDDASQGASQANGDAPIR
jgi:hypothetical protein